jgi:hypothetical protein
MEHKPIDYHFVNQRMAGYIINPAYMRLQLSLEIVPL